MLHSAASGLGPCRLPMFHKKDDRLIWVKYFFITLLKHLTKSLFNGRIFLHELNNARCYES